MEALKESKSTVDSLGTLEQEDVDDGWKRSSCVSNSLRK